MTFVEKAVHTESITTAKTEKAFVPAFVSYVQDTVTRETDPYEKITRFVHSMLETNRLLARPPEESVELSVEEVEAHATALQEAENSDDFQDAFSAFAREVIARESNPHIKIAVFTHDLIQEVVEVTRLHARAQNKQQRHRGKRGERGGRSR